MPRSRTPSAATRALLAELLRGAGEWRHGYDLARATGIASGTLYPVLMRLESRGLLEARWEAAPTAGRPARHVYRLTAAGVAYARDHAPADAADSAAPLPAGGR